MVSFGRKVVWLILLAACHAPKVAENHAADNRATAAFTLVDAAAHQAYMQMLPQFADAFGKSLATRAIVFYSEKEIPKAFQHGTDALMTFTSANSNPSGTSDEFGHPNNEFPWNRPEATDASNLDEGIKFYIPPADGSPIKYQLKQLPQLLANESAANLVWEFPKGAIFGEMLRIKSGQGQSYTFEVRLRVKRDQDWVTNVYRPFANPSELADAVKILDPNWQGRADVKAFVEHCNNQSAASVQQLAAQFDSKSLTRNSTASSALKASALVDTLPPLPEDVVIKLLTNVPFQSVRGRAWRSANGATGFAPTTKEAFHIVPKDYLGPFLEVSNRSCQQCHQDVLSHARSFNNSREWSGRVRGSDRIFSFHPIEPDSIANGNSSNYTMNRKMSDGGLVVQGNVTFVPGSNQNNGNGGGNQPSPSPIPSPSPQTNSNIVEFHIRSGTASGAWNTSSQAVQVQVGQILRIINDDSVTHRLHTNGYPCPHGPDMEPGESYDCRIQSQFDPGGDPLYDHYTLGPFWFIAR